MSTPEANFETIPTPLACQIQLDEPHPGEDVMILFLNKHFPSKWSHRQRLSEVWPYGRVFETSSGFHGEYLTPNTYMLSLIHLGHTDLQAIRTMKNIMQQNMYINALKELY